MYSIIPITKTTKVGNHDFIFSDFSSFYKIANTLTVKLTGAWDIGIKPINIQDVKDFVTIEEKYKHLRISIYLPEQQVDYLTMRDTHIHTEEKVKPFEIFQSMCSSRNLLFAKGVQLLIYKSIDHDTDTMEQTAGLLYTEFGSFNTITEKMVQPYFILNKTVYPRTVLLQYLWLARWRESSLKKCIASFGNDVTLYAIINNIKKLMESKCTYFKTGEATNLTKSIDTQRLCLIYRVFVVERGKFSDVAILLKLYERGLSCYDFIQNKENQYSTGKLYDA